MGSLTGIETVRPASRLNTLYEQLQRRIAGRLETGVHSSVTRYGLRRDLNVAFEKPKAKIPISVRPLVETDLPALLHIDSSDPNAEREVGWRRAFATKRMKGGYVAVDDRDGTPCYVQWLLGAADNDFIATLRSFPQLQPDEALLEHAYTPARYRGMRIMPAAMAEIAERAVDFGARYVLTFVAIDNIPSLKGCQRAGFAPDLLHKQTRLGFNVIRRNRFTKLASDDPVRVQTF